MLSFLFFQAIVTAFTFCQFWSHSCFLYLEATVREKGWGVWLGGWRCCLRSTTVLRRTTDLTFVLCHMTHNAVHSIFLRRSCVLAYFWDHLSVILSWQMERLCSHFVFTASTSTCFLGAVSFVRNVSVCTVGLRYVTAHSVTFFTLAVRCVTVQFVAISTIQEFTAISESMFPAVAAKAFFPFPRAWLHILFCHECFRTLFLRILFLLFSFLFSYTRFCCFVWFVYTVCRIAVCPNLSSFTFCRIASLICTICRIVSVGSLYSFLLLPFYITTWMVICVGANGTLSIETVLEITIYSMITVQRENPTILIEPISRTFVYSMNQSPIFSR